MKSVVIKFINRLLNALELCGIILVIITACIFQFFYHELPCPLCLLQRLGFFLMALGFLLNLRFGLRPSHYALVILSALFTAFVALRQIALHVVPGTGDYGSAIFGMHMYTWSFIICMIVILFSTVLLSIDRQYLPVTLPLKRVRHTATWVLLGFVLILGVVNFAGVMSICGFNRCPDNPMSSISQT